MPYFIYLTDPFINEKNYPNIDAEEIFKKYQNKLPLLAMAGIFDINRTCQVCKTNFIVVFCVLIECFRSIHCIHV